MNPYLRDKLLQKLETLSDERGYQVLDYVEFLESKYAEQTAAAGGPTNPLSRFADAVEEKAARGKVSASTIAETMGLMNKAVGVLRRGRGGQVGGVRPDDATNPRRGGRDHCGDVRREPDPRPADWRHDWCDWGAPAGPASRRRRRRRARARPTASRPGKGSRRVSPTTSRAGPAPRRARAHPPARARHSGAAAPRTGAKRTVMYYIKQLPAYLRLLGGLLTDRRVSTVDKLLVAGAIAYIAMPIDLIPDFIPFIGEVDDVFILVLALSG